ncbi:MAG: helix-turn-helix transcriptional regulator [Chloroflexota bacterium]|nr:helix-turn-helix transcriptional regulator [Dehalococcoidia bacterium]MDW8254525.1 helix-turn-helix transcriptional regulator [Chloroflexota bacterium]
MQKQYDDEPCYVISVAARLLGVHAQTLRYYERLGLVEPSRSRGNIRLYSARDIERLQQIKRLVDDLGVNLAGVEVILQLSEKVAALERELRAAREELERLRAQRESETHVS